jgi:hypothetical protein
MYAGADRADPTTMKTRQEDGSVNDRALESSDRTNDARDSGLEECWSEPISEDHRSLRCAASDIRAALARLHGESDGPPRAEELLVLLLDFRARLFAHFEHEEATCVSSSACQQAGAPARSWLEAMAAEHLELRQRFDAVVASLERCVAGRGTPPEALCAEVAACLDHLAQHELSEARLFQVAVLWH